MDNVPVKLLMHTPLFKGLDEASVSDALKVLDCRIRSYEKEENIFSEGQTTRSLGIVLDGSVRIERVDYAGTRNILSRAGKNQIFAETYALKPEEPMMVDVNANTDCTIAFVNISLLKSPRTASCPWYPTVLMNLLDISNRKNLELSRRSFFTAPKRARGRILSYLSSQAQRAGSRSFDIPFNREQLADYLNLDRSALSRELSSMQDEGLIQYHKNHFELRDF